MARTYLPAAVLLALLGYAAHCERRLAEAGRAERERAQDLDHVREATAARARACSLLCDELIEGRRTLPEVAEEFACLNRHAPRVTEAVAQAYPAPTERQSAARQAALCAKSRLQRRADLPAAARAVAAASIDSQLAAMMR